MWYMFSCVPGKMYKNDWGTIMPKIIALTGDEAVAEAEVLTEEKKRLVIWISSIYLVFDEFYLFYAIPWPWITSLCLTNLWI